MESTTIEIANIPKTALRARTYGIVSKVAYLIGVSPKIFAKEQESLQIDVFRQLEKEKRARIIRNLCIIRTAMEKNFAAITEKMQIEYMSPTSMPEFIPQRCVERLAKDGVSIIKASNKLLTDHISEINHIISERIYNCKVLFPAWIKWEYIQDLFIMPNGLTLEGRKEAAQLYYDNMRYYPYGKYINWHPYDVGNLLESDQKFLRLLYQWHKQKFTDYTRLTGVTHIRDILFEYIMADEKAVVLVDCEHADPHKLTAALKWLDAECRERISSVILFEGEHTVSEWDVVERFTGLPVECVLTENCKDGEAQPLAGTINLLARAYQEHYGNHVNSFIIVSNDSGHWKLLSPMPEARSFVVTERKVCSIEEKDALIRSRSKIPFCYVDDSYPDESEEVKFFTLVQVLHQSIGQSLQFNAYEVLDTALQTAQMQMTQSERQAFFTKYFETMQIAINKNGDISVEFKGI